MLNQPARYPSNITGWPVIQPGKLRIWTGHYILCKYGEKGLAKALNVVWYNGIEVSWNWMWEEERRREREVELTSR